jgi:hypothetical protein
VIITERDCEARAAKNRLVEGPGDTKTEGHSRTKVLCRYILQPGGSHRAGTQNDLTGPGIECLADYDV